MDSDTLETCDHGDLAPKYQNVLEAMSPGVPYSAGDLAEDVDVSRRSVDRYLRELVERGLAETKQLSNRTRAYWVPPKLESVPESREDPDSESESAHA